MPSAHRVRYTDKIRSIATCLGVEPNDMKVHFLLKTQIYPLYHREPLRNYFALSCSSQMCNKQVVAKLGSLNLFRHEGDLPLTSSLSDTKGTYRRQVGLSTRTAVYLFTTGYSLDRSIILFTDQSKPQLQVLTTNFLAFSHSHFVALLSDH